MLPHDRRLGLRDPSSVYRQRVIDDVVVVLQKHRRGQLDERVELRRQGVVRLTLLSSSSFEAFTLEVLRQVIEAADP